MSLPRIGLILRQQYPKWRFLKGHSCIQVTTENQLNAYVLKVNHEPNRRQYGATDVLDFR